jgi:hypothetical protein
MSTGYGDQVQAAVRDAARWVDTNDTSSGYIPRDEAPPAYAVLYQRFQDSDPLSHTPCEHLKARGPQVAHWFTEWPTRAWCHQCALPRMRRLARKRRPCLNCGQASIAMGEVTFANIVLHATMCDRCGLRGQP